MNRRDVLKAIAIVPAALPAATLPALPPTLRTEGRRLVSAYHRAFEELRVARVPYYAASDAGKPPEVWGPLEDRFDDLNGVVHAAERALMAFLARATGYAPRFGRTADNPAGDYDKLFGAAVALDGVLWVVNEDPDGARGELLLTHLPLADVVTL